MPPVTSIFCIGAGYVGGPTMVVIADRCPDVQVLVVDINQERIDAWNSPVLSKLPVYEPGLDAFAARSLGSKVIFSTVMEEHMAAADFVMISVNSPYQN